MNENKRVLINGLTKQETEATASCAGLSNGESKQAEPVQPAVLSEQLLGAIARGWCHERNKHKVMDSDLAYAIAEEVKSLLHSPAVAVNSHVNETPKNEHDSDDVLNKTGNVDMTRTDYLNEISRFKRVLDALDFQHRLNGHQYTPSEIQSVRKSLRVLEQLVEVGLFDIKREVA